MQPNPPRSGPPQTPLPRAPGSAYRDGSSQQLPLGARQPSSSGSHSRVTAGSDSRSAAVAKSATTTAVSLGPHEIPSFELVRELGRGGVGVVYEARDLRLGRTVALKRLLLGAETPDTAEDFARFRAEAELIARLAHPNIVGIHEVGQAGGQPYLCLEFCAGGSLARRLAGRPVAARAAAETLATIAAAVGAAHRAGIIHRDLKPSNVLLDADGKPKISDFGLAKRLDTQGVTRTGHAVGTPTYMAPEQAEGLPNQGPPADVYSLGVMLYEMLTGRPPFLGDSEINVLWQLLSQEPVAVRQLAPRVPVDLETICHKCLHKQPARRYRNGVELAEDLRNYLAGRPIAARPVGPLERGVKWARRHPGWAALLGVGLLATAGLAGLSLKLAAARRALLSTNAELSEQRDLAKQAQSTAEARRQEAESAKSEAESARTEAESARAKAEESAEQARAQRIAAERATAEAKANLLAAKENFELARKAVSECFDLAWQHPAFQKPGLQEARELLLRTAQPYHERFRSFDSSSATRTDTSVAYLRAGFAAEKAGDHARAAEAYRQALPELERLVSENPKEPRNRALLATTYNNLGLALMQINRLDEALTVMNRSLALTEKLAVESPEMVELQSVLASSHTNIGLTLGHLGRGREALERYEIAKSLHARVLARLPDDADMLFGYQRTLTNLGAELLKARRWEESLRELAEAEKLANKILSLRPNHPETLDSRSMIRLRSAQALEGANRPVEAIAAMRGSLADRRKLAEANAVVRLYWWYLASDGDDFAKLLARQGRPTSEIKSALQDAEAVWAKLARENPEHAETASRLSACRRRLDQLDRTGKLEP